MEAVSCEMQFRLEGELSRRTGIGERAAGVADKAGGDGLIPPPTNPPTVDCLGGQCRRQSCLPSSLLWH